MKSTKVTSKVFFILTSIHNIRLVCYFNLIYTLLFDFSQKIDNFTSELISQNNNDLNDPCTIYVNECMNNINICYNLYEKSTDIFHSLVIVINNRCLFIN